MGKHRKRDHEVTRRRVLGLLAGATGAAGVTMATRPLYHLDELHAMDAPQQRVSTEPTSTPEPTSSAPTQTSAPLAPETTTAAPPTTSPPSKQPEPPSLATQLDDQPRSGWGLQPAAAASAHLLATLFGIKVIGGYRPSSEVANSDHPRRLAADFMTSDQQVNRALGNFAIANRKLLRVKYVISLQHYNDGSGWSLMADRGSRTANHFDHCHVSFV